MPGLDEVPAVAVRVEEDGDRAVAAYTAKEKELEGKGAIEIVLIGSDSLETVKLTHANYFDGSVAVSKYLAGIAPSNDRR